MTALEPVTGVILAGGLSRRMGGGDKGLLDLGGVTMLGRVIDRLQPQVGRLVINANGDAARFAAFGLPVVADATADYAGPLAGVLAGMRWSLARVPAARHIATVSSDAPFLPLDLVAGLSSAIADRADAIALARSGGDVHPVIGLWPVALADDLQAWLAAGTRKVLAWVDRHASAQVDFPQVEIGGRQVDPFFNANTPEELAAARALIGGARP
jgi:molybdopterin-guanine dinucleotide biosynthesis protein A